MEQATINDFKKLEFRIATILEAQKHPNADRLLVLSIEMGQDRRQIVAGIANHYAPEALVGKQVVIVANLEPAVIRGVQSQGMLLAASSGEALTILTPEQAISSGAQVR